MIQKAAKTAFKAFQTTLLVVSVLFSFQGFSQAPEGYYSLAEGKNREDLKEALNEIIKGHVEYPYTASSTDTWDILKETDRDPANESNVICIYSNFSRDAEAEYDNARGWSREHVWAKSRGDFGTSEGPGTDVHHLRAADVSTNSARSNRNFAAECDRQYNDGDGLTDSYSCTEEFSWEPPNEVKGDVARMLFYMATRYEGQNGEPDLELTDVLQSNTSKAPLHSKLSVLLAWHESDPVSQLELDRNDIIYGYQQNRNPFIDRPEFVDMIWGEEEIPVLSVETDQDVIIFPNPANDFIQVTSARMIRKILVVDLSGKVLISKRVRSQNSRISLENLQAAVYVLQTIHQDGTVKKSRVEIGN